MEKGQRINRKGARVPSTSVRKFNPAKVDALHIFAPEHVMIFEEENCGRFIKKTVAIPNKYFGKLIGVQGTTIRILEILTNTVISLKRSPMSKYWRYIIAAGRCHYEVNNVISLIHFLLKYSIDLDVQAISSICLKVRGFKPQYKNPGSMLSTIKVDLDRSWQNVFEKRANWECIGRAGAHTCRYLEVDVMTCCNKPRNLGVPGLRGNRNICFCKANRCSKSGRTRQSDSASIIDCIQVKNNHVGRIMGTKGCIIAIIEHFTNTVISFKDMSAVEGNRLVCIKGQRQKDINCAKEFIHLIIFRSIRFGILTDQLVGQLLGTAEGQLKLQDGAGKNPFVNVYNVPDREWIPAGMKQLVRHILLREEAAQWNCAKCVQLQAPCSHEIRTDNRTAFHNKGKKPWRKTSTSNPDSMGSRKMHPSQWRNRQQGIILHKCETVRRPSAEERVKSNAAFTERVRHVLQSSNGLHALLGTGCKHDNNHSAPREQFLLAEMIPNAIMPFSENWESKCSELGISRGRRHNSV
uniref:K Homology domain-containing protein n=1 Tax=Trichuris muris TaxID=70415 RepID=A0A5S6QJG5_TRIMR